MCYVLAVIFLGIYVVVLKERDWGVGGIHARKMLVLHTRLATRPYLFAQISFRFSTVKICFSTRSHDLRIL